MLMSFKNIIFDLDGTLIDSAPSILAGFSHVFEVNHLELIKPLTPDVIGPPLIPTLSVLSGIHDEKKLKKLAADFKEYYDVEGCILGKPYLGVSEGLKELAKLGINLHIATNKRFLPTQKIARHLGWDKIFSSIYTLDKNEVCFKSKSSMIQGQLNDLDIPPRDTVYVGDRLEDMEAALTNQVKFIGVSWGYGDFPKTAFVIQAFDELYKAIKR